MRKLFEVAAGELLSSGIFPGLKGEAPPLWADANNVVFVSGTVKKQDGYQGSVDLAARPTGLRGAQILGARHLYVGAGNTYYDYTLGGGLDTLATLTSPGGIWMFDPWGEDAVVSNGIDGLHYYDRSIDTDLLVTTPFSDAVTIWLLRLQEFAVDLNNIVYYSDVNDPTDWTPVTANSAGSQQLREIDGQVVAGRKLGGSGQHAALYTEGSSGLWTYVGGTNRYDFHLTNPGCGAGSHYAVIPVGEQHFTWSRNRAMVSDGISFRYIDEPQVREYMDETVNLERTAEVYGWHDQPNSSVRWILPSGASDFVRLSHKYDTRRWSRQVDGTVCGEYDGAWPDPFVATANRLKRQIRREPNDDGAILPAHVQTKPLHCGDRQIYKQIEKVVLKYTGTGILKFQIGYMDEDTDDPVFGPVYTAKHGDNFLDVKAAELQNGLFVVLKIFSDTLGARWTVHGFELWGEPTALRN